MAGLRVVMAVVTEVIMVAMAVVTMVPIEVVTPIMEEVELQANGFPIRGSIPITIM